MSFCFEHDFSFIPKIKGRAMTSVEVQNTYLLSLNYIPVSNVEVKLRLDVQTTITIAISVFKL